MKKKKSIRHWLEALIMFITICSCESIKANNSAEQILNRHKEFLLNTIPVSKIETYCEIINTDNRWDDITYINIGFGVLGAREHLFRVRMLAAAWANPTSNFYHNKNVWSVFQRGLNDWLHNRYQSQNWWHNEIGTPQTMRDIVVLTRDSLSSEQYQNALQVIAQHKVKGTGANLIWSADIGLSYGALLNDTALVKQCVRLITSEIKITNGDGVQPDYSYHQHGNRLQTYHYGGDFLKDNIRIAWELQGTEWQYPPEKIKIITDFVLNGWQWMARGINTIPNTIDRASSRENALKLADLRKELPYLIHLSQSDKVALETMLNWQNGKGESLKGFRYFPYSDFAAFHQKDFSFFLKTISTRTLPTESINDENLKGSLLNNGNTYFVHDGTEYFNLMPVWNWQFLPGSTSFSSAKQIVRTDIAGGVGDGESGLVAMKYKLAKDSSSFLTANKMWACHNNTIVCLISDIKIKNLTDSVFTVMDQSKLVGAVLVNGKPQRVSTVLNENVKYIYHNHFIYKPITTTRIKLNLNKRKGSWSAINISGSHDSISTKVFMPLMYHNQKKKGYGYSVQWCPNERLANDIYTKNTFRVLQNDSICQAIRFDDGVIMIAFQREGSLKVSNSESLRVTKPCFIVYSNKKYHLSSVVKNDNPILFVNNKPLDYLKPAYE